LEVFPVVVNCVLCLGIRYCPLIVSQSEFGTRNLIISYEHCAKQVWPKWLDRFIAPRTYLAELRSPWRVECDRCQGRPSRRTVYKTAVFNSPCSAVEWQQVFLYRKKTAQLLANCRVSLPQSKPVYWFVLLDDRSMCEWRAVLMVIRPT